MFYRTFLVFLTGLLFNFSASVIAKPNTPKQILTPNQLNTSIGTLEFFDGVPSKNTVKKAYNYLDTMRGVQVFLRFIPVASLYMMCEGLTHVSKSSYAKPKVMLTENFMDSTALFLTANTSTIYATTCLDLKKTGPTVVEVPQRLLGAFDDARFLYMQDIGPVGPDKGKGGKYIILPPGYQGKIPAGYYPVKSQTYKVWLFGRGLLENGTRKNVVNRIKRQLKIYPLSKVHNPPKTVFYNGSNRFYNTIHANNFEFFNEINAVIQHEPADIFTVEERGLRASIGIIKGKPFRPSRDMRKILTDAAYIGNAIARAIVFYPRDPNAKRYSNRGSKWVVGFINGNVYFLNKDGSRNLDARTMFHYPYTGVTPAMATKVAGRGSDYAMAYVDSKGRALNGSNRYKLHLPANIPAKDFWAITIYDTQTRSLLQTSQKYPTLSSQNKRLTANEDGSYDIYFGPTSPKDKENNWLQTIPNKSWFVILRIYGPLNPWLNKTWRPGNIKKIKHLH